METEEGIAVGLKAARAQCHQFDGCTVFCVVFCQSRSLSLSLIQPLLKKANITINHCVTNVLFQK